MTALKRKVKANLPPESLAYKGLAFIYRAWRAAYMRLLKDSRFNEDELSMASLRPQHLLDAVLDRYHPSSFLDVGCGVGYGLQYVVAKGVECLGLEGSKAALAASPVPELIRLTNLNHAVNLGRKFDLVWSFEVAEHIHPVYTDVFLETLTKHGDVIAMSAARPGQGGCGHFNEQPPSYWIERLEKRGYRHIDEFASYLHTLSDDHSCNMMVFERREMTTLVRSLSPLAIL